MICLIIYRNVKAAMIDPLFNAVSYNDNSL